MKRELDFGLDGSVSPTRESVAQPQTQASSSTNCKRVKGTQVNGYIVYTRVKKSRTNYGVEFSENIRNKSMPVNGVKETLLDEDQENKNLIEANNVNRNEIEGRPQNENTARDNVVVENVVGESLVVRDFVEGGPLVEAIIEESHIIGENAIVGKLVVEEIGRDGRPVVQSRLNEVSNYNLAISMSKEESVNERETCLVDKGCFEGSSMQISYSSDGSNDDVFLKALRLSKQSLTRPKVEAVDNLECEQQAVENVLVSNFGGEESTEESELTTSRKNLELKMSKKVALTKCPMTVKELFDTGLLDGVPVVYMGTISSKTAGLRGIIADGGILCSCSLCKGRRVVPPSQFEIHACKQYKRAAQYICFENGKSLLDVLRACRRRPLHTLEATIQNILSALPEQKSFTCRKCKGVFSVLHAGQTGLLCNSCVESKKSQCSTISAPSAGARPVKPVLVSKTLKHSSPPMHSPNESQWKMTTKDQRLHKLVFEEDGLPDGTEVAYYARGQRLLEGYKKGFGIICRCCNCEVSPSQFEAHAGWASRRKPYAHIYTSNGVSLHELAISLSEGRRYSSKYNDNACIICADGGDLLFCDGCLRAFHKECASLPTIPHGRWYCKHCQNMFMREKFVEHNVNALAAGRILGVDAIEQITSRCIRIVKNFEAELSGCALCRACDFSKSGFGPRTIILCDQCEKEYHIGCLRTNKMADLREIPKGKWFCCSDCSRIHSMLQRLLTCGAEKLPDSLLNVIRKKYVEKGLDADINIDVRWRLLSGRFTSETRLLLSQAVGIFHECFDPIVDVTTGRDLIPCMVYGRNLKGQEYGGMYCAVLTINSFVVSAGIIRIFGQQIAELPLVATSIANHGKGYFQLLFSSIEKLLGLLNVKTIVLPAAEEAESIWTDKFGFRKLTPNQLSEYRKSCNQMVIFKGTTMLQKEVPPCQVVNSTERTELHNGMD
ncbi:uncharacterized protein LOC120188123 [Hibiscus syriacus]|uniref:uncharacterized protein LOC120188123 n=1 Tax=Hibiscus syriacus TaxID=106335 RepID=UPI0019210E34|nr:uncharacterized protein LOC120188123 [Hibiscus syriacus]